MVVRFDGNRFRLGLVLAIDAVEKNQPATFEAIVRRLSVIACLVPDKGARVIAWAGLRLALKSDQPASSVYHLKMVGRRICSPTDSAFALPHRGGRRLRRLPGRDAWVDKAKADEIRRKKEYPGG